LSAPLSVTDWPAKLDWLSVFAPRMPAFRSMNRIEKVFSVSVMSCPSKIG